MKAIGIGLLGCGTVGRGFVHLLGRESSRLRQRYGLDLSIRSIAVRNPDRSRPGVHSRLLTLSAVDAIRTADIVVEVIGGIEPPLSLLRTAIALGRDVVTANKAVLAERGAEIFAQAALRGVAVGFEASVCGGIPVVRALGKGLAGDSIESLTGILNGTSNFVLTRMEEGLDLESAVRMAQQRGFAEADPSLDLDGSDAAQKLRLLASLAFAGQRPATIEVDGIRAVRPGDIVAARSRGAVLRHLATASQSAGRLHLRVGVRELPEADSLARVRDESNALRIRARSAGEVFLSGRGAGALPTASALLSDVIEIALLCSSRTSCRGANGHEKAEAWQRGAAR